MKIYIVLHDDTEDYEHCDEDTFVSAHATRSAAIEAAHDLAKKALAEIHHYFPDDDAAIVRFGDYFNIEESFHTTRYGVVEYEMETG